MMMQPSSDRGPYRQCFRWSASATKIFSLFTFLFFSGAIGAIGATGATGQEGKVDKILKMDGIAFHVLCPNQGSLNPLTIIPSGLQTDNTPIKKEVDGSVNGAEVADLNGDGSPEIYVYINSAGSGSYGSLVAYSVNKKKSLSEIFLPPLQESPENSKGYMGHDEFKIIANALVRRFPVYNPGDSNAEPTGGIRSLQYRLVAGEAGWVLQLIPDSTRKTIRSAPDS